MQIVVSRSRRSALESYLDVGMLVAMTVCFVAALPVGARAQEAEPSAEASPTTTPQGRSKRQAKPHTGAWVAGAFVGYADDPVSFNGRAEVGIPVARPGKVGFSIRLPIYVGGNDVWPRLAFVPGGLLEITLYEGWGRFAIAFDMGVGVGVYLARGASTGFGIVRANGGAAFTFPFGLFIEVLPLGVAIEFGTQVNFNSELTTLVGYRF